jgi:hypothetical protein
LGHHKYDAQILSRPTTGTRRLLNDLDDADFFVDYCRTFSSVHHGHGIRYLGIVRHYRKGEKLKTTSLRPGIQNSVLNFVFIILKMS